MMRKRWTVIYNMYRMDRDDGMSMVELIIAVVVSAIVLSVIAMLFGNGLSAIQKNAERDLATGKANSASLYLADSMRNATGARVVGGGDPNTTGFQNIYLSVQLPDGSYECRYWLWHYGWTDTAEKNSGVEKGGRLQFRSYADRRVSTEPTFDPLKLVASWDIEGTAEFPVLIDGQPSYYPGAAENYAQGKRVTLNIGVTEGDTTVMVASGSNALVLDNALAGKEAALVCGI